MSQPPVSAVLVYQDRIPLRDLCSDHGYLVGSHRVYRGDFYRQVLNKAVESLIDAGVDEVILVTWHNDLVVYGGQSLRICVLTADSPFSEWDAKYQGICEARYDHVITTNAAIIVPRGAVEWFRCSVLENPHALFQGTKGWLSEAQTLKYLDTDILVPCMHEVVVRIENDTEVFVDGLEPVTWSHRRSAAAYYLKEYGIDLWKHSGDFQAFERSMLSQVEYPRGSIGWGWGDIEFRLRAQAAGLQEVWYRAQPIWHMSHPIRPWIERRDDCEKNMHHWGRGIDMAVCNDGWVRPPTESLACALSMTRAGCDAYPNRKGT